ncbi:MAG: hypothetical protein VW716_07120, partial [Gammaproteobacteria bacterium]
MPRFEGYVEKYLKIASSSSVAGQAKRWLQISVAATAATFLVPAFADHHGKQSDLVLAPIIDRAGTYSRPISTKSKEAQAFFDQGLRLAWGFYFPEAILSYQTASHYDPEHPMPYWGLAHAMGPNPNSRYARMPDDPKGEGLKAINAALARIENATPIEAELIRALHVLYDKESISDDAERDQAYLAAMRELNRRYPDHSDIAALYAGAYMSIGRWD